MLSKIINNITNTLLTKNTQGEEAEVEIGSIATQGIGIIIIN